MKFPRPTVRVGKCLAIFKKKIGHRKMAGPCTKGRKQIMYEGEPWKPSRLSYHLNIAPIPRTPASMKRDLVLHTCDHEWCVDPKHLYKGTQTMNVNDMYKRNPVARSVRSAGHIGLKHTAEAKAKIAANNRVRWRK